MDDRSGRHPCNCGRKIAPAPQWYALDRSDDVVTLNSGLGGGAAWPRPAEDSAVGLGHAQALGECGRHRMNRTPIVPHTGDGGAGCAPAASGQIAAATSKFMNCRRLMLRSRGGYISTCPPSSMTRFGGMWKNSVAGSALRCMKSNT